MMVNLLVVEDDLSEIADWGKIVSRHNQKPESEQTISFHLDIAKNIDEARIKIRTYNFSVAIIDVRLKREEDTEGYRNTDGIDVLHEIMETTSCFSVVYTGQRKDAEANISSEHQSYIKVVDRTTSKMTLLNNLIDNEKDIILSIHEMKIKFSKSMSSLFYKSIWPRWNYWKDNESKSDALHRHMATHLHAHFLNEGEQKVHPEEYFFIPPLREQLDTGDIFKNEQGQLVILVTPRCELAQDKHDTFQLITLDDVSQEWTMKVEKVTSAVDAGKRKTAQDSLRRFSNHSNNSASCHFIPEIRIDSDTTLGPFFARFNKLTSMDKSDDVAVTKLKGERIASLSNEFIPSLVERLGNFFSRIGTPDYSHPE